MERSHATMLEHYSNLHVRILYFKYESFPFELYNAYIRINSMSKHAKKRKIILKKHAGMFISMNDI